MPTSTSKRLILYRFDRQPVEAVAHADSYLEVSGAQLMTRDGNLQLIDYKELKAICFVSEGASFDLFSEQTVFERRPKAAGLWASFRFRDGDVLEGVLPRNLLEWPPQGYLFMPPGAGARRQRVFVPREAVSETVMRGVIGALTKPAAKVPKEGAAEARQMSMFD